MLSTPLFNAFSMLRASGQAGTPLYNAVGKCFLLAFFLCRVVFLPVAVGWYFKQLQRSKVADGACTGSGVDEPRRASNLPAVAPLAKVAMVVGYGLNLAWFAYGMKWMLRKLREQRT
jgi:hypothetical protein